MDHPSVSDVFFENAWHMYDASLINYFVKDDGTTASSAVLSANTNQAKTARAILVRENNEIT